MFICFWIFLVHFPDHCRSITDPLTFFGGICLLLHNLQWHVSWSIHYVLTHWHTNHDDAVCVLWKVNHCADNICWILCINWWVSSVQSFTVWVMDVFQLLLSITYKSTRSRGLHVGIMVTEGEKNHLHVKSSDYIFFKFKIRLGEDLNKFWASLVNNLNCGCFLYRKVSSLTWIQN